MLISAMGRDLDIGIDSTFTYLFLVLTWIFALSFTFWFGLSGSVITLLHGKML